MSDWITITCAIVFWGSLLLLAHSYAGYPMLLGWLCRRRAFPEAPKASPRDLPEVAVLMAVYNEEAVLEETLTSILDSDYPAEKRTVWVGSDGSTDGTHAILRRFERIHPGLRVEILGGRNGKIRIVNRLAEKAAAAFSDPENGVFVLCDANVSWTPDAMRRLVDRLRQDASIGLVGAAVCDAERRHDGIGDQEEAYVGRENLTKYHEGLLWGNTMGAFGACYAMRARLFTPVPTNYIVDDFFQTMEVLETGSLAVVELDAVCHEAVSTEIEEEFRRKQRIATGNFQNFRHFLSLFLPWSGGWANAFAFWSHKGLRWLGPLLLIAAGLAGTVLAFDSWFYRILWGGMAAGVAGCAADALLARSGARFQVRPLRFLRYFLAMNLAIFLGMIRFLGGAHNSVWEPTKRVAARKRSTADSRSPESVQ